MSSLMAIHLLPWLAQICGPRALVELGPDPRSRCSHLAEQTSRAAIGSYKSGPSQHSLSHRLEEQCWPDMVMCQVTGRDRKFSGGLGKGGLFQQRCLFPSQKRSTWSGGAAGEGPGLGRLLARSPPHPPCTPREASEDPRGCRRWRFSELMVLQLCAAGLFLVNDFVRKYLSRALQPFNAHPKRR